MAKIHVPFLYARNFATGHPLLSAQNFPPFLGVPQSQIDFKHRALSHPLLIYFSSLELTEGTSAVISLIVPRPGALATASLIFRLFWGVSQSQIDFKHRALSHPLLVYFNDLELTDGTSAVISLIVPRPGALATASPIFRLFLGDVLKHGQWPRQCGR